MWAAIIGEYYKLGLYTKDNVKVFVMANWIKDTDYKTITGEDYSAATASR